MGLIARLAGKTPVQNARLGCQDVGSKIFQFTEILIYRICFARLTPLRSLYALLPAGAPLSLRPWGLPGHDETQNSGEARRERARSYPFATERQLYSRHGCFMEGAGSGRTRQLAVLEPDAGQWGWAATGTPAWTRRI
jgi:hypothetical protein